MNTVYSQFKSVVHSVQVELLNDLCPTWTYTDAKYLYLFMFLCNIELNLHKFSSLSLTHW